MRYAGKGAAKRFSGNGGKLHVEGEFVTVAEIAERLGMTQAQISHRKAKILASGSALTWGLLRAQSKARKSR